MLKQTLNKGISTPIAIGIILALVILVGGFTWWQFGEIRKEEVKLPEIEIPEEEEGVADRRTYKDEKYGFEIEYPSDWRAEPNYYLGEPNMVFCPPEFFGEKNEIWLGEGGCATERRVQSGRSDNTVIIEGAGEVSYEEYEEEWKEKVNEPIFGIYLFVTRSKEPSGYINWNLETYDLLSEFPEYKSIYNQMLSSFRFIKRDGTTNWKIYKDERYGYQIKYPTDWAISKNILGAFDVHKNFSDYNCSVEVYVNTENYLYPVEEAEGYFQSFSEFKIFTKEEIASIGGISGKKLLSPELAGREIYFFKKEIGDNYYYFNIFLDVTRSDYYGERIIEENKCRNIFKEILLTFQFTDKITDKLITEPICKYRKGEYEMRIYDSEGRMTGIKDGEIKEEIPGSYYNPRDIRQDLDCPTCQTIGIPDTTGIYRFEIFCIKEGNYKSGQNFAAAGELLSFRAINIPIISGVTHRYDFDWESLAKDREGVAIFIDLDNDDLFEKLITSDEELTCEEFIAQLKKR